MTAWLDGGLPEGAVGGESRADWSSPLVELKGAQRGREPWIVLRKEYGSVVRPVTLVRCELTCSATRLTGQSLREPVPRLQSCGVPDDRTSGVRHQASNRPRQRSDEDVL